ncbi:MAG: ThiF family adenylyltransferase [Proteobacteria bacterium]|nr:ThiF family adenylyltransferase [Pseudomonadota bacterium]
MKSDGQAWALGQMADIAQASAGLLEIDEVQEPQKEGEALSVTISVDCSAYERKPGGVPLKQRERLLLQIGPNFPLEVPRLSFTHKRYGDAAHVQWGNIICLYQSTETEWQPEDGMFGLMARINEWLRAAAANDLDPIGMPLHPPVTYSTSKFTVVPTENAPNVPAGFWAGYAKITRESDHKVELGEWFEYSGDVPSGRLAVALLLPTTMPHEYPTSMADLLKLLEARGIAAEIVRLITQLGVLRAVEGKPLIFVLGAAMRGIAGGPRLQHLTAWHLNTERVDEIRKAIDASTDAEQLDVAYFQDWAATASIEWCRVLEDRPEIVTRRDVGTASIWWRGRSVVMFGCGAIGSVAAMLLARAGVAKLTLYDRDIVKPGVLVRQSFGRYQIGLNKADAMAQNVKNAVPAVDVRYAETDVVARLKVPERLAEILAADVIINATASTTVAAALEKEFRGWPKKHPPVISMALGHRADQALMTMAVQDVPGISLDLDRRFKIALSNVVHAKHVVDEFWPVSPERRRIFQPEPGCSSPTFIGSAADVMALTAQMTNVAGEWLAEPDRTFARARSFDLAGPKGGSAREFAFDWQADIILRDGRHGYQVRISRAAMSAMRGWMRRSERVRGRRDETGGVLFGHFDPFLKVVWVDEVSGPPPDSVQSPTAFICGTAGVAEMNEEKRKRTRDAVAFVGMWHTHPGGMPWPSPTDRSAMAELLTSDLFKANRFLMVIIGAEASQPIISGTVFERADYQS